MKDIELWLGDCLELMKDIPDNSIDMILCDLPYGSTKCKWDIVLPFDGLWEQYERIIKNKKGIVLFGSEPFSSLLRVSNLNLYKYDWYWNKKRASNFAQGNKRPMKIVETISVFSKGQSFYCPQKTDNPKGEEKRIQYKRSKQKLVHEEQVSTTKEYSEYGKSYEPDKILPKSIIEFRTEWSTIHPTQKPISLLEYLIKTYTIENELVLDNTMGSGSTMLACKNTSRRGIGIEKEKKYYDIAVERLG